MHVHASIDNSSVSAMACMMWACKHDDPLKDTNRKGLASVPKTCKQADINGCESSGNEKQMKGSDVGHLL